MAFNTAHNSTTMLYVFMIFAPFIWQPAVALESVVRRHERQQQMSAKGSMRGASTSNELQTQLPTVVKPYPRFEMPFAIDPKRDCTGYYVTGCFVDTQTRARVYYKDHVAKEDREPMTTKLCWSFCKGVSGASYFGLEFGRECYCMPFFESTVPKALYECDAVCEGDKGEFCGGMKESLIYQMHDCNNLPPAKCSDRPPHVEHAKLFKSVVYYGEMIPCANYIRTLGDSVANALCEVQCEYGYELTLNHLMCKEMGDRLGFRWGEFHGRATCSPVNCGIPNEVQYATFTKQDLSYPTIARYNCVAPGYTITGKAGGNTSFDVKCEANGTLIGYEKCLPCECGLAPKKPHTLMTRKQEKVLVYKEFAEYSCTTGYSLDRQVHGPVKFDMECKAGGLFAETPKCKGVSCGDVPSYMGAVLKSEVEADASFTYPNSLEYTCGVGYSLDGKPDSGDNMAFTVMCQADGDVSSKASPCERVSCGTAPPTKFSTWSPTDKIVYEDEVVYTCREGYTTTGKVDGPKEFTTTCGPDGNFSKPKSCLPVECGVAPELEYTGVTKNCKDATCVFPEIVDYQCNPGYSTKVKDNASNPMFINYTSACQASGRFECPLKCVNINNCLGKTCGGHGTCIDHKIPTGIPEKDWNCNCTSGYEENITDANKICININDCPTESSFAFECSGNGKCIDLLNAYDCDCSPGFTKITLKGLPNITCVPMNAGAVPKVEHASFVRHYWKHGEDYIGNTTMTFLPTEILYTEPARTYTCNEGFTLTGDASGPNSFRVSAILEGEDKVTISKMKTCLPVSCGAPYKISHADASKQLKTMFYSENETKRTITYTCHDGYTTDADSQKFIPGASFKVECSPDGKKTPAEACLPVHCGMPPAVDNAVATPADVMLAYPKKVTYECATGYSTDQSNNKEMAQWSMSCKADGNTSAVKPCLPIKCGKPPEVQHGSTEQADKILVYEETVTYKADECFTTTGKANGAKSVTLTCLPNSSFSHGGSLLPFKPIECGQPLPMKYATWLKDPKVCKETVEYTCKLGYSTDQKPVTGGDNAGSSVECLPTGKFTPFKKCKPVLCEVLPTPINAVLDPPAQKTIDFQFQNTADFKCSPGYALADGSQKITVSCQADGTFEEPPQCKNVNDCEVPQQSICSIGGHGTCKDKEAPTGNHLDDYECLCDSGFTPTTGIYKAKAANILDGYNKLDGDCYGANLKVLEDIDLTACLQACSADPACTGSSYGDGNRCVLKNEDCTQTVQDGWTYYEKASQTMEGCIDISGTYDTTGPNYPEVTLSQKGCSGSCPEWTYTVTGSTASISDGAVTGKITGEPGSYTIVWSNGITYTSQDPVEQHYCLNINDCPADACKPGKCHDLINDYECICPSGYYVGSLADLPGNETCAKQECGEAPKIGNSTANTTGAMVFQDVVEYTCNEGYTLTGVAGEDKIFTVTCGLTPGNGSKGTFSTEYKTNECKPVTCGIPDSMAFSTGSKTDELVYPQKLVYTCMNGYSLDRKCSENTKYEMECTSDGSFQFVGKPQACDSVLAGSPEPEFAQHKPGLKPDMYYPEVRTMTCIEGYSVDGKDPAANQYNLSAEANCSVIWPQNCTIMQCGAAPVHENCKSDTGDKVVEYEGVVTYTAESCYSLNGKADGEKSFKIGCLASGKFEANPPDFPFKIITCGSPPNVEHASSDKSEKFCTDVVTYTCVVGYSVSGKYEPQGSSFSIKCENTGKFTEAKVCLPVTCDVAPTLPNSEAGSKESHVFKEKVSYTCLPGYSTNGKLGGPVTFNRTCMSTGKYSKPEKCVNMNDCEAKSQRCGPNGKCVDKPKPTGNTFDDYECQCDSGFEPKTLEENGKKYRTCGNIPDCPKDACLPGTCTDLVNDYKCNCLAGYHQAPNPEEGLDHDCLKDSCGKPPTVKNAKNMAPDSDLLFQDTTTYECNEGYSLDGSYAKPEDRQFTSNCSLQEGATVNFMPDGAALSKICKPVECGAPAIVNHAKSSTTADLVFEDTVEYKCEEGYSVTGDCKGDTSWTVSCSSSGEYISDQDYQCLPVLAGAPQKDLLQNAIFHDYQMVFNDSQNIKCEVGYSLDEDDASKNMFELKAMADCTLSEYKKCVPVSCGVPQEVEHTTCDKKGDKIVFPNTATWTTDKGYTDDCSANGTKVFTASCTSQGKFESIAHYLPILPVCCGVPAAKLGATMPKDEKTFGQKVLYTCKKGWSTDGKPVEDGSSPNAGFEETCLESSSFSDTGNCKLIECPSVPVPQFSKLLTKTNKSVNVYNDTLVFKCFPGFSLDGKLSGKTDFSVKCQTTGKFSKAAECVNMDDCADNTCSPNGQCEDNSAPTGIHVWDYSCKCDPGFKEQNTSAGRTCENVPDCPENACHSENGDVVAQGTCHDLVQDYKCTCPSGSYTSDDSHDCLFQCCGKLPKVPNSGLKKLGKPRTMEMMKASCQQLYGETFEYTCEKGYTVDGTTEGDKKFDLKCEAGGKGSKEGNRTGLKECKPVSCGAVPTIFNATASATSFVYPEVVEYKCAEGFSTLGTCDSDSSKPSFTISCSADGEATFDEPNHSQCIANAAGIPVLDNAQFSAASMVYPESQEVTCFAGYSANAKDITANTFTLKATPHCSFAEHPTCVPVSCGIAPTVANATSTGGNTFGESLLFTCDVGFSLDGKPVLNDPETASFNVSCQANGTFEEPQVCKPVECPAPPEVEFATMGKAPDPMVYLGEAEATEAAAIEFCKSECKKGGHMNLNPSSGSDQILSCSQACMIRARGSTKQECSSQCDRTGQSGCSLVFNGFRYTMCAARTELTKAALKKLVTNEACNAGCGMSSADAIVQVTYTCAPGYSLDGKTTGSTEFGVGCTKDGELLGLAACLPIECPDIKKEKGHSALEPINGTVVYQETVKYLCETGYSLTGKPAESSSDTEYTEECQADGTFTDKGKCENINFCLTGPGHCGKGGTCEDKLLNYSCKCAPGYAAQMAPDKDGAVRLMCVELNECETMNGTISCTPHGECIDGLDKFTCKCDPGYKAKTVMKDKSETCEPIMCHGIPKVKNTNSTNGGKMVPFPTILGYTCKVGFSTTGKYLGDTTFNIGCQTDGTFKALSETGEAVDGAFPECKPVACGDLPSVNNSKVTGGPAMTYVSESAVYKCDKGYTLSGHADGGKEFTVSCTDKGELTELSSCVRVKCGSPPEISKSSFTPVQPAIMLYSDTKKYTCDSGYTLDGKVSGSNSFDVTCEASGKITGRKQCTPVSCGAPPKFKNASSEKVSKVFGESAEITCDDGFIVKQEAKAETANILESYNKLDGDCYGANLKVLEDIDLTPCLEACSADPACTGSSYGDGKRCVLKNHGCSQTVQDGWTYYEKAVQAWQMMAKGSGDCKDETKIQSLDECYKAHEALGLTSNVKYEGQRGDIPSACSTRQGRSHDIHWNKASSGKGRSDLTPICRKAAEKAASPSTFTVDCEASGSYSQHEGCKPVSCGHPVNLGNATPVKKDEVFYPHQAAWKCNEGFNMNGKPVGPSRFKLKCEADAKFEDPIGCIDIDYCSDNPCGPGTCFDCTLQPWGCSRQSKTSGKYTKGRPTDKSKHKFLQTDMTGGPFGTNGDYACSCFKGYETTEEGTPLTCIQDDCHGNPCGNGGYCIDLSKYPNATEGAYTCSCNPGFVLTDEGKPMCVPVVCEPAVPKHANAEGKLRPGPLPRPEPRNESKELQVPNCPREAFCMMEDGIYYTEADCNGDGKLDRVCDTHGTDYAKGDFRWIMLSGDCQRYNTGTAPPCASLNLGADAVPVIYKDMINYKCLPGFSTDGGLDSTTYTVVCAAVGSLVDIMTGAGPPECVPVICGPVLPQPLATTKSTGLIHFGETITYTCEDGYVSDYDTMSTTFNVSCGAGGDFSEALSCQPQVCGPLLYETPNANPNVILGSIISYPGYAIYQCDQGYQTSDNQSSFKVSCSTEGKFVGETNCTAMLCPGGLQVGASRVVKCGPGQTVMGSPYGATNYTETCSPLLEVLGTEVCRTVVWTAFGTVIDASDDASMYGSRVTLSLADEKPAPEAGTLFLKTHLNELCPLYTELKSEEECKMAAGQLGLAFESYWREDKPANCHYADGKAYFNEAGSLALSIPIGSCGAVCYEQPGMYVKFRILPPHTVGHLDARWHVKSFSVYTDAECQASKVGVKDSFASSNTGSASKATSGSAGDGWTSSSQWISAESEYVGFETGTPIIPKCIKVHQCDEGESGCVPTLRLQGQKIGSYEWVDIVDEFDVPTGEVTVPKIPTCIHQVSTDFRGGYRLQLGLEKYHLHISNTSYVTYSRPLNVDRKMVQENPHFDTSLSRRMAADEFRIVLQWKNHSEDLDMHLIYGQGARCDKTWCEPASNLCHCYYANLLTDSCPNTNIVAELENDERNGIGPETIRVQGIKKCVPSPEWDCKIIFFIDNYTPEDLALGDSGAEFYVYGFNMKLGHWRVPRAVGDKRQVPGLIIDASTGEVRQFEESDYFVPPPPDNSCVYSGDGACDEPDYCYVNTDCSDCGTC